MENPFNYADIHCHPNLKTFGHSFDDCAPGEKCNVWHYQPPGVATRLVNILTGITRFSQSDFTTMRKGGAKVIVASLYPFEKGFFINAAGKGPVSAWLSDLITGIGYNRIRYLQKHTDYFADLENEYRFFINSQKSAEIEGVKHTWRPVADLSGLESSLSTERETAVILSIEGAHAFNSGLKGYGKETAEGNILENVRKVKKWEYPPLFITFAHNFNNDLCGHSHSLEPIRKFVDQTDGMNMGFTALGKKVLSELLSPENGRPVFIDIKHMSLTSRKEYFDIINSDYGTNVPPTIVSHGAVNGLSWNNHQPGYNSVFYPSDLNFFDEEIEQIGRNGGLFAIQFDARRIARMELVRKKLRDLSGTGEPETAAQMIWHQIRHIAETLDNKGLSGWKTACIGSDYDGTIDPLPGVWTAEQFPLLEQHLLSMADYYLRNENKLKMSENRCITPEEVVSGFFLGNVIEFLKNHL